MPTEDRATEATRERSASIGDGVPPEDLALIAGDAIHNLRSALDHIAWELVAAGSSEPNHRTQFPVGKTQASYRERRSTLAS